MFAKLAAVSFLVFFIAVGASSQPCTTLGQTPSTAFPVCGSNAFSQTTVPYCGGTVIPGQCSGDVLTDLNPFWYKFTCSASGTLGFVITPNDLNDDYDWQIFDITGHNPGEVFTNASLFVSCNWSGNTGRTGTSASGSSLVNCAGRAYPTFSAMPVLETGHNYIMVISHFTVFTPSQNGYKLSFGGGTANIIDPVAPDLFKATPSCGGKSITVTLSKKMKCSSLATDGSDFVISSSTSTIVLATGNSCSAGFDMDSLVLVFDNPLMPGQHTLTIKNGTDGNTLLDNCDREIPVDNSIDFEVFPILPVPMDSLTKPTCAPQTLELVFKKNILCNSIAADASDFEVSGPSPVTLSSVGGNCSGSSSNVIRLVLSGPVVHAGTYRVKLLKGSDGNTLIDECGQEVLAGSELTFTVKDTVNSAFSYSVLQGCTADTIRLRHDGRNGVNAWHWTMDYAGTSGLQNADAIFKTFGSKQILLSVTNGFCSDTTTQSINLGNELNAGFETSNLLCPEDPAIFLNKSIGNIVSYNWDLGDGNSSISETPVPEHYPFSTSEKIYNVRLIVKNDIGCFDTAINNLKVLKSCYIAVPNAFTPNGDGLNDYLYPVNAFKADNLDFKVYNRIGQLVFHTTEWTNKWDGKINGEPQDSGIFVWMLSYTNRDTGKKIFQKGSTALLR
ncbi:MAG: gliding motility-associated C-terminal domain-containing protein [Ginsengibacter sp.]